MLVAAAAVTASATVFSALLNPAVLMGATGLVKGYDLGVTMEGRRGAIDMTKVGGISAADAAIILQIFTPIAEAIQADLNKGKLPLGDEFYAKVNELGLINLAKNAQDSNGYYAVPLIRGHCPIPHSESDSGRIEDFFKIFDNYYTEWKGNKTDIYTASVKVLDNFTYLLFSYLDTLRRCPGSEYANAIQITKDATETLLINFLLNESSKRRGTRLEQILESWFTKNQSQFRQESSAWFDYFKSARSVMATKFGKRIDDIFDESANYQRNLTVTEKFTNLHDTMLKETNLASEMLLRTMSTVEETGRLTLNMMAQGKLKLIASSRHDLMYSGTPTGKLIQALAERRLANLPCEHTTAVSFDTHADQGAFFFPLPATRLIDPTRVVAQPLEDMILDRENTDLLMRAKVAHAINALNIALALCNELKMEIDAYGSIGMRYTGDLQSYHAVICALYQYSYQELVQLFKLPYFANYMERLVESSAEGAVSVIDENIVQYMNIPDHEKGKPNNKIRLDHKTHLVKLILETASQHKKVTEYLLAVTKEIAELPKLEVNARDAKFVPETNQRRAANIALIMLQNPGLSDFILPCNAGEIEKESNYFINAVREQHLKLGEIQKAIAAFNAAAMMSAASKKLVIAMPLTLAQFRECDIQLGTVKLYEDSNLTQLATDCLAIVKSFYLTLLCVEPALEERKFRERVRVTLQARELRNQVETLTGVESELQSAMQKLDASAASNQQAIDQTARLKTIIIQNLEREVSDLHTEIGLKLELIGSIRREVAAIDNIIMGNNLEETAREDADRRCKLLDTQIEKLRESELAIFKHKIARIEEQKATYGEEFADITRKIEDSVTSLKEARAHLANALSDIDELKRKIEQMSQRIEQLVAKNVDLLNMLKRTISKQVDSICGLARELRVPDDGMQTVPEDLAYLKSYFDGDTKNTFDELDLNFINWLRNAMIYLHKQDQGPFRSNKYKAYALLHVVCHAVSAQNTDTTFIISKAKKCFTTLIGQISAKNKTGEHVAEGAEEKSLVSEISEMITDKKATPSSNPAALYAKRSSPSPSVSPSASPSYGFSKEDQEK